LGDTVVRISPPASRKAIARRACLSVTRQAAASRWRDTTKAPAGISTAVVPSCQTVGW
jgi:hypothetical protein